MSIDVENTESTWIPSIPEMTGLIKIIPKFKRNERLSLVHWKYKTNSIAIKMEMVKVNDSVRFVFSTKKWSFSFVPTFTKTDETIDVPTHGKDIMLKALRFEGDPQTFQRDLVLATMLSF
jgi:hypothetical protein